MSLNAALGHALTGLTATARMAEVVSSNLANALTEGYARRSVDLTSASLDGRGAGVRVGDVARHADRALLAERRGAGTLMVAREGLVQGLVALEKALAGGVGGTSLSDRLTALDGALVAASADPSSTVRLGNLLNSLDNVAGGLREASSAVTEGRQRADAHIATQVNDLNAALAGIEVLNVDIASARTSGRDATGLLDQRQVLVDQVATIVPIREMDRPNGAIALITPQGATLLDGRAGRVSFDPSPVIDPTMTLAAGGLSGLMLDGVTIGGDGVGRLGGGGLGAQFALRDDVLPAQGASLDALAADLLGRFESPAIDPTRLPGAPGVLTDAGDALDLLATAGLAGRIRVSPAVDPAQGGALWRMRDGTGATVQGQAGDAAQIVRWRDALATPRATVPGGLQASASTHAANLLAGVGASRLRAEEGASFATARWTSLRSSELAQGVDSDHEMQMLLQIELAYAANARVISTIDAMMQTLLEI